MSGFYSSFILHIYIMDNINTKIGISSSIIIIAGCLLKAFHLQGAAIVLTSGFLFFSLIKLYRWRINIKDSNKSIILPEVHYEKLERLEAGFNALAELVQEVGKLSQITDRESKERIEESFNRIIKYKNKI